MSPVDRPCLLVVVDKRRRELWDAVRPHMVPHFRLVSSAESPGRPGSAALLAAVESLADDCVAAVLATGAAAVPVHRAVAAAAHPPRLVLLDPVRPDGPPESGAEVALTVVGRTDGTPGGGAGLLGWRHHGSLEFGAYTVPSALGPGAGALCRAHIMDGLRLWWSAAGG